MDFRVNAIQPYEGVGESIDHWIHPSPKQDLQSCKKIIREESKEE